MPSSGADHDVRGNRAPNGGFYKLDSSNTLPVWLREAGYATAHIGKYLNGYGTRDPRQVSPRLGRVARLRRPHDLQLLRVLPERERTTRDLRADPLVGRACPGAERRPRGYQADLYTRKARGFIARCAPSSQPFFLSVAYLAPHSGGPHDSRPRCQGSAKPVPRHRLDFADARLPRPPGFNEADVSDKPAFIRRLPRLGPQDIDRIRTDYQCRRESLWPSTRVSGR